MGWFWGSSSTDDDSNNKSKKVLRKQAEEAVKSLDPTLEEYLKSSTPQVATPPAEEDSSSSDSNASKSKKKKKSFDGAALMLEAANAYAPPPPEDYVPPPPHAQSSYGDKYADLWASYKPFNGGGFVAHTDQQRIHDFADSMQGRKGELRRAAIENCAFEHETLFECYKNGAITERLMTCQQQSRVFSRCVEKQAEFLKVMGFMGVVNRPDIEEAMQMRADRLYRQEMAENEAADKKAAAEKATKT